MTQSETSARSAHLIQTIGMALNQIGGTGEGGVDTAPVPAWIQLTPVGPDIEGRDGRRWTLEDPEAVVAAFRRNGTDLPVDIEHATQVKGARGEPAPAVGWIRQMEARDGALWARVDWNDAGRQAIASRGYRYASPAFTFRKVAGQILNVVSAGLTNQPNFQLAALNSEGDQEEPAVNKTILEALGLPEGASEADALKVIDGIRSDEAIARNRAETPDASCFVPRADYDLALNRLRDFEAADKARHETMIGAAVDAATEAGKIAPASRDYHIAACRDEGGLERFRAMVDASPGQVARSGLDGKAPGEVAGKQSLSEEEMAVCRALDMSAEDYAAARAAENTEE